MTTTDDGFDAWIERYRAHLELEGLAARTLSGRTGLLGKFLTWCREMGIRSPKDLTVDLITDYRRYRIQFVNARGHRDHPLTVNTHLLALRDFVGLLVKKGAVPGLLLQPLGYVKAPKLLPKEALTHAEVMKLLSQIPGDTPIHLRDRAILEVLYSTGLRRQELVDLSLADLDLEGRAVRVECGKGGKGRMTPIGKAAVEWVERYLASARPALLGRKDDPGSAFLTKSGSPMSGNDVKEVVRRWAQAAGIAKNVTPHTLRRSCATGMIRNRANLAHVKDLLGHEDYRSLESYIRLEIVDLKEAHRKFHPREQGNDDDPDAAGAVPVRQ